ncbi:MAG TPA: diguanylate cyclase [Steroidobacteraceae bacterium]|nr:diguanylate cyclase [Steroidobacteraceae bacterium]
MPRVARGKSSLRSFTSIVTDCIYGPRMTAKSRLHLHAQAEPACSTQVQDAEPPMRFEAQLEVEYVRARLQHGRTLVRMACLLALLVVCLRIVELALTDGRQRLAAQPYVLIFPLVVFSASVLLAWFAWRPSFPRRYLPFANYAVPMRNVFAAAALAAMAARGQVALLIVMPAMVLGPFFFLGLHFRPALVCVTVTIAAFAASALFFEMPATVLLRSCGFLVVAAGMSALGAWQIEKQSRRSFLERRLIAQLAEHDALTGAKNRRVFDEQLSRLWQQAVDDRRPLAIPLIDVDHFKDYNDRYGHQAGDVALQQVAKAVQAQVHRPLDVLSRYGGEEFAALLYDIDGAQARHIAEKMRLAVSALRIEHRGSSVARVVTISVGVAAIQPVAERGPLGALQLADEALYAAKVGGRNKVHVAAESEYSDLETGIFVQRSFGA